MRVPVIKMEVDVTSIEKVVKQIVSWRVSKEGGYVCVSNVHMCMEVLDNPEFMSVVNDSDLTVPDGKPIAVAQKLLGHKEAQQVRGMDLTLALCRAAQTSGLSVGFFGATNPILNRLKHALVNSYPGLKIAYTCAPPFSAISSKEDAAFVQGINDSGVDILFVGLGCPKQETWMAEHKGRVSCVMLGVGAAFDFVAGSKKNAPMWMQSLGLEWMYRLASEPKRLWKRYLKHNPRFVWYLSLQLLGKDFSGIKSRKS